MTDERRTFRVPDIRTDDDEEVLVRPEDIRSTSRSCLVILIMMLIIVLMICAFLVYQGFAG